MGDLSVHFSRSELRCSCCEQLGPWDAAANVELLEVLRLAVGFPLFITSGYRCPDHPIEVLKAEPGEHSRIAVDVTVSGHRALMLTVRAYDRGWTGIGWQQHGAVGRYVHLDRGDPRPNAPRPSAWSY